MEFWLFIGVINKLFINSKRILEIKISLSSLRPNKMIIFITQYYESNGVLVPVEEYGLHF